MSLYWSESLKQTLQIMVFSKFIFQKGIFVSKCANLKKKINVAVFVSCSIELKPIKPSGMQYAIRVFRIAYCCFQCAKSVQPENMQKRSVLSVR